MKKSEMIRLSREHNVDLSDLLGPLEGKRGRLPLTLIAEVKNRLTDAGWVPTANIKLPKPTRTQKQNKPDPVALPPDFKQKDFVPGQKLWQHTYGFGRLSKNEVTFIEWHSPGKAKVKTDQDRVALMDQFSLHPKQS